jgi:hypothetical protein
MSLPITNEGLEKGIDYLDAQINLTLVKLEGLHGEFHNALTKGLNSSKRKNTRNLEYHRATLKKKTIEAYESNLAKFIERRDTLRKLRNTMRKTKNSKTTRRGRKTRKN